MTANLPPIPKQQWLDSEGRSPNLPPGTTVTIPCLEGLTGTVLYQQLHHDGYETFFGNVYKKGSDQKYYEFNGWQCKKIDG